MRGIANIVGGSVSFNATTISGIQGYADEFGTTLKGNIDEVNESCVNRTNAEAVARESA